MTHNATDYTKNMTDYRNEDTGSGSNFAKGLFIGGLLGAAAALLFAPKPGRDLRGDLSDKMMVVSDRTKEVAGVVGTKASEIAKTVSGKTSELAKTVGDNTTSVVASIKQAKDDVASEAKKASDEVAATTAKAADEAENELNSGSPSKTDNGTSSTSTSTSSTSKLP